MNPIKVLLVEGDDHDAARIIATARREGMEICWLRATDEEAFLSKMEEAPDAVVTDFGMPSLSAWRVLELLRGLGALTPVLVVTGAIADDLAAECIKRGAADFLLKDRLARLREALEGAIERSRALRRRREADRRILAAARRREVLNEMLLRSLSVDLSEASLRTVLEPLFEEGALPGLISVGVDIPGLAAFSMDRPVRSEEAGSEPPLQRVIALTEKGNVLGRIEFHFAKGSVAERESLEFLDDATYVLSGVIKRARAEKRLRRSLQEQEELLREIHHRVKNNLAAVQSLVDLDAARLGDGPGRTALEGLKTQVRSMALVHELLYSRGSLAGIDFEEYISELKLRVAESLGCPHEALVLVEDCFGFRVPLETALTLGIVFNELFTRAANRASARSRVELSVTAVPGPDGSWRMEYLERGGPSEGSVASASTTELELVKMLIPQYQGALAIEEGSLRLRLVLRGDSGARAGA
jgi:two-component sensor histidine kinase/FixJ family two-component response regulator